MLTIIYSNTAQQVLQTTTTTDDFLTSSTYQFVGPVQSDGATGATGATYSGTGNLNGVAVAGGGGGKGGYGAIGGLGDRGGDGGIGGLLTADAMLTNTGTLAGGAGGNGGNGGGGLFTGNGGDGGSAGAGGVGAVIMSGGQLINAGTITGGAGGRGGNGGMGDSASTTPGMTGASGGVGAGGVGVTGTDASLITSGTIAGGLSGDGVTRADAVQFTGGTNSLTLTSTAVIQGHAVAFSTADTLGLGGPGDATFDATQIGAAGSAAQDQGFGILRKSGASTWTLDGQAGTPLAYQVAAGTLDLGGTTRTATSLLLTGGTLSNGTLASAGAFDVRSGTIAAGLAGSGALTKSTAGTVTLASPNTYTGATTVAAGTLLVDGDTAGSIATVEGGATLGGFGAVGGLVAQSGATVAPGLVTPFSTLNVAGNVAFQAGSTFQVQVNAAGQTDAINATGTATITGGIVTVQAGSGTYAPSRTYTLLTAAGGRTGTFANLTTTSNLAFLTPTLTYDATHVRLGFAQAAAATFPDVAATANQRAAASGLQGLPTTSPLYQAVLSTSTAGARAGFDATSGEINASAATAGIQDTLLSRDAIFHRLDEAARGGPAAVAASQPFGALVPVLPRAALGYAPAPVLAVAPPSSYAAWGSGFGDFGQNRGNGNAATLDRSLGGFILGADTGVNGTVFDGWRLGVAGGYTDDSLRVADRGASGSFESYFGGLYAGTQYGAIDIKLGALGGGTTTTTARTIAIGGFGDQTRASYGGTLAQGFGEIGDRIGVARGYVEPLVQVAAIHIGQDGFRERGDAAALLGIGHDTDVQTTTLGVKAEQALPVGGLPMIASGFLGWRHAFGDVDPRALLAFQAGGPAFTVEGAPIDRDAVTGRAGLDYRASPNLTLGIHYAGQAGPRANDNAVQGALTYRF